MRHVFPTIRSNVRGFNPYLVRDENGKILYLFEVTRRSSIREVLGIEREFSDGEFAFATLDESVLEYQQGCDAANYYELGGRASRPLYVYKDHAFYETEVFMNGHGEKRLRLTDRVKEFKYY